MIVLLYENCSIATVPKECFCIYICFSYITLANYLGVFMLLYERRSVTILSRQCYYILHECYGSNFVVPLWKIEQHILFNLILRFHPHYSTMCLMRTCKISESNMSIHGRERKNTQVPLEQISLFIALSVVFFISQVWLPFFQVASTVEFHHENFHVPQVLPPWNFQFLKNYTITCTFRWISPCPFFPTFSDIVQLKPTLEALGLSLQTKKSCKL